MCVSVEQLMDQLCHGIAQANWFSIQRLGEHSGPLSKNSFQSLRYSSPIAFGLEWLHFQTGNKSEVVSNDYSQFAFHGLTFEY